MYKAGWYHHLGLRVVLSLANKLFHSFLGSLRASSPPSFLISQKKRSRSNCLFPAVQLSNWSSSKTMQQQLFAALHYSTALHEHRKKQINIFVLAEPVTHMLNWLHWTTGHVGRNIKCVLAFNTVVQSDLLDVFSHALACGSHSVQGLPVTAGTQQFLISGIWKVQCLSVSNNQTSKYIYKQPRWRMSCSMRGYIN